MISSSSSSGLPGFSLRGHAAREMRRLQSDSLESGQDRSCSDIPLLSLLPTFRRSASPAGHSFRQDLSHDTSLRLYPSCRQGKNVRRQKLPRDTRTHASSRAIG